MQIPPVLEVLPGAVLVAMEQRSGMDEQLKAHLLGADPQPEWPSQARPRSVQWCPGSRTWEVSWPDSENLSPGRSVTGVGGHSFSKVAQAVLGTSSHG